MQPNSYARHQVPPTVIRQTVRLSLHFTLSYRDIEEFLPEHGLKAYSETIRRWVLRFRGQHADG